MRPSTPLRMLLASLLLASSYAAAAQTAPEAPKEKPAAPTPQAEGALEKPRPDAKPKPDAPVLEITRLGRAGCEIKPVMTDDEIEACRRAAYQR